MARLNINEYENEIKHKHAFNKNWFALQVSVNNVHFYDFQIESSPADIDRIEVIFDVYVYDLFFTYP